MGYCIFDIFEECRHCCPQCARYTETRRCAKCGGIFCADDVAYTEIGFLCEDCLRQTARYVNENGSEHFLCGNVSFRKHDGKGKQYTYEHKGNS